MDEYIIGTLPSLAHITTFYWRGFHAENVTYPLYSPNFLPSAGKHVWAQPVAANTVVPIVGDHSVNTGVIVQRILNRRRSYLPMRYVLGAVEWLTHGNLLATWAIMLGEKEGCALDVVYVKSDVDTVGQLWPGFGKELGQMFKLSEALGKKAWTKNAVDVLALRNSDLKVGHEKGDLVSTETTMKKLTSKRRVSHEA